MLNFLLGLVLACVGFLMIYKNPAFMEFFDRVDWAERNLSGGTRSFYKLLGLIFILLGFVWLTGLGNTFLNWALAGLFRR